MTRKRKTKPFPWTCPRCLREKVRPSTIEYSTQAKYDGRLYDVTVPELIIPTCSACGELVFCNDTDEQISRALRDKLGLLQPDEIRARRKELLLTQRALAERIGVAQETISRWESGLVIQARAMNRLLRVFFYVPDARSELEAGLEDSGIAANLFDWASSSLSAPLMSTGVFVDLITWPAAIIDVQTQMPAMAEVPVVSQWPIVGESSWEATAEYDVPAGSAPRIAA